MLQEKLRNYRLILGSASPRRLKFLEELRLPFVKIIKPIMEDFPSTLIHKEIPEYISKLKAEPFIEEIKTKDILFTCDTIVWHQNKALGKPKNKDDAFIMLKSLSDNSHEVISSICFTTRKKQVVKSSITSVYFRNLSDSEIDYYISEFKPFDKAGAYGIQEWIGQIGIKKIEGSYENVVGLPTQLFYDSLNELISNNL